jgi:hypothetical protein
MLDWDRSHDWVLHRFWNDLTRITIHFRQAPPTAAELAALRRCLPRFRDTAPSAVRAALTPAGVLPLGEMPTREARRLIEVAQAQGLDVVAEGASFASYLPYDRTSGCVWLIEDNSEAAAVAEAMLAAGVPVQEVEA